MVSPRGKPVPTTSPSTNGQRSDEPPFVAPYRTERNHYIYDVNTNRMVLVTPVLFEVISRDDGKTPWDRFADLLSGHEAEEVTQAVKKYRHLREEHGLFSSRRSEHLQACELTDDLRAEYGGQMRQLIIELTENCNLRCKYCAYSEYYPLNRNYSPKTIPFETARKAIDLFLARSLEGDDSRAVSFYGGEPLMEVDLLARCVEYARDHQGQVPIRFSLTTNATLITPEVLARLVELDVNLLVSLDGPPHCHDQNRVFPGGGGSASRVLDILRMVQQAEPDYYRTHVGFASVIAPNTEPADYYLFFRDNQELLGEGIQISNYVSDGNTDYWCLNPPSAGWSETLSALRWKYYESLVQGELSQDKFLESLFRSYFLKIYKRSIYQHLPDTMPLNGCCQPGIRRLFVDCQGNFHMCERINKTLSIGHVDRGLDFERIKQIMDEYRSVSQEDCSTCWLIRFCTMCFATTVGDGGFDRQAKRPHCDTLRRQFLQALRDYCEIAEINPAAFNYMEDIVVK